MVVIIGRTIIPRQYPPLGLTTEAQGGCVRAAICLLVASSLTILENLLRHA
jgi:hypothetical protein